MSEIFFLFFVGQIFLLRKNRNGALVFIIFGLCMIVGMLYYHATDKLIVRL